MDEAGRGMEAHTIRAGAKTGEKIMAVRISCGGLDRTASGRATGEESNRDAGNSRFARVLTAVAISIIPNKVADRPGTLITAIDRQIVAVVSRQSHAHIAIHRTSTGTVAVVWIMRVARR